MSGKESVLTESDNPGDILNNVCDVLNFLTDSFYSTGVVLDDNSIRGLSLILAEIQSSLQHANKNLNVGLVEKVNRNRTTRKDV